MRLACCLAVLAAAHGASTAAARMRGSAPGSTISGTVRFEQPSEDPLADVIVTYSLAGLTPGAHGFHVHQYGDVRNPTDLSTMGAHFVPQCVPPEVGPDGTTPEGGCNDDQVHGLPPNERRQPGDMGNIVADAGGNAQGTLVLGQRKMSLSDALRSVLGRVVVVHSTQDDGSQPYGNAGLPQAYGVIGAAVPASGVDGFNGAIAPSVPKVDKIICSFEEEGTLHNTVYGSVLLTLEEPYRAGFVHLQARLYGLQNGQHSFHFHTWGDMTAPRTSLGQIYQSSGIHVETLAADAQGTAVLDMEFETPSLLRHVGRALTVHGGPTAASETIAAAVCGLSNPRATLDTSDAPKPMGMSSGAQAVLAGSFLLFFGCFCFGIARYLGYCRTKDEEFPREMYPVPPPPPA